MPKFTANHITGTRYLSLSWRFGLFHEQTRACTIRNLNFVPFRLGLLFVFIRMSRSSSKGLARLCFQKTGRAVESL